MNRQKIGALIVAIMLIMTTIGCSMNKETGSSAAPSNSADSSGEDQKLKIGVSVLDLANPYFVQIVNGVKAGAEGKNIEIIVDDPKSDVSRQVTGIENFISAKVDGIIVAALDPKAIDPIVKKAREAGIKVIAQATTLENADMNVAVQEYTMGNEIGKAAGQWIADKLDGEAEVAVLNYPRIPQIIDRERGITEGIAEHAPNAKVVATASAATPEEGMKAMESILQAHPNVKVVAAINDSGALGAYQAMRAAGKDGDDVFIGGIDATPEALDNIKQNTIFRASVDIQPLQNGEQDLEFMLKLIAGEEVPSVFEPPATLVDYSMLSE
ncbi:sugar ABC transporter substrate-binding protein [Paenibacillaceae bacterium WGS1546]|uniref:sugar ABC transporter substrate-binding protein n=1 Tax=Cohnella sp. WGS1546 TaxID=3366810 RepID=UPI00372D6C3C